ncbi:MAG: hypothetical protein ABI895_19040 [Deltaproteobacteria bacterium]
MKFQGQHPRFSAALIPGRCLQNSGKNLLVEHRSQRCQVSFDLGLGVLWNPQRTPPAEPHPVGH